MHVNDLVKASVQIVQQVDNLSRQYRETARKYLNNNIEEIPKQTLILARISTFRKKKKRKDVRSLHTNVAGCGI